jgi:hypothetical protein
LVQHRLTYFAEAGGVGARARINPAQVPLLEELRQKLARGFE